MYDESQGIWEEVLHTTWRYVLAQHSSRNIKEETEKFQQHRRISERDLVHDARGKGKEVPARN
jgi:hypothetical protein